MDECSQSEPVCTKQHQKCINTKGSYVCICEVGYEEEDGECLQPPQPGESVLNIISFYCLLQGFYTNSTGSQLYILLHLCIIFALEKEEETEAEETSTPPHAELWWPLGPLEEIRKKLILESSTMST